MKRSILVLFMLASAVCAFAQQQYQYVIDKNIPYRTGGDEYVSEMCNVDVAYVQGLSDRPVIVWFHGGGMTGGSKEVPQALMTRGYIVVGVGYRLYPKVKVQDIVKDAAAAVAWTFKNIEKYGGSTSKIYLAGHSAGGTLVDLVGLDKSYLAEYGIDADSIAALVPYSGQVVTHYTERGDRGIPPLQPIIDSLAPLYHMRPDCPPMLVISGDREMELYGRYEETAYFVRMMKLHGHKDITFYELDGFEHGDMVAPGHLVFLKYLRNRERQNQSR
jgi:acetyl esterase/lipase